MAHGDERLQSVIMASVDANNETVLRFLLVQYNLSIPLAVGFQVTAAVMNDYAGIFDTVQSKVKDKYGKEGRPTQTSC